MHQASIGVCFVSSHRPRECGIATFTQSIINNITIPRDQMKVVAISEARGKYEYDSSVVAEIIQDEPETYEMAARAINDDPTISVVSLQHVFSLFGGEFGDNITLFLKHLKKPVVTTLHMVYSNKEEPNSLEVVDSNFSFITDKVIKHSTKVVVIIQQMADLLVEQYGVDPDKIAIIPHGTPVVRRQDATKYKRKLGLGKGQIISTFGLIRSKKGLEYLVRAMPAVVEKYPYAKLLILGEAHPNRPTEYYDRLVEEARSLKLLNNSIYFRNDFLTFREIIDYLLATDVFVTPYTVPEQTSSGAIAYAMACGKAIISTPFAYAREVLADKRGLFVNYNDPHSIYLAIDFFFSHPKRRERMEELAYEYARNNSFKLVARKYAKVLTEAASQPVAS